jgi:hypothetical protein
MKLHFLFAALGMLPEFSSATSFYIRPMEEVVSGTPNIVRGIVRSVQVEERAEPRGGNALFTVAGIEVKEVLKGSITDSRIEVKRAGGEKNGVTLEIPGSPQFTENEETVLFLSEILPDHSFEVRDMALGKFGIDRRNGTELLSGGLLAYGTEKRPPRDWSIRDLKALIESRGNVPSPSVPDPSSASTPRYSPTPTPGSSRSSPDSIATPGPESPEETSKISRFGALAFGAGLVLGIGMLLRRMRGRGPV